MLYRHIAVSFPGKSVLATLALSITAIAFTHQAQGQLLRYNFDEGSGTAVNSGSASGANLTTFGSQAGYTASGGGISGQAGDYAYTGTADGNNYASAAGAVSALNSMSSFTITGWMNTSAFSGDSTTGPTILNFFAGYGAGMRLVLQSGGELALQESDYSMRVSSSSGAYDDPSGWRFFAVSWDGTGDNVGKIKFYLGTTESAVTSAISTINRGNASPTNSGTAGVLRVGNNNTPGTFYEALNGQLDDLRLYGAADGSAALSVGQIEAIRLSAVPEPSAALLAVAGFAGMVLRRNGRRS